MAGWGHAIIGGHIETITGGGFGHNTHPAPDLNEYPEILRTTGCLGWIYGEFQRFTAVSDRWFILKKLYSLVCRWVAKTLLK